jgi:hypothetical protein
MQFDLAAKDNEYTTTYFVFDPAAVQNVRQWTPDRKTLDREAAGGDFYWKYGEQNDEWKFRIYVDEAPPERVLLNAKRSRQGKLLRVPSGQVCAAGLQDLVNGGAGQTSACVSIPRGEYLVDEYSIRYPRDPLAVADPRLTVLAAGCVGTILLVPTALILVWAGYWKIGAAIGALVVLFWLLQVPSARRRARREREQLDKWINNWGGKEPPDTILVLHPKC